MSGLVPQQATNKLRYGLKLALLHGAAGLVLFAQDPSASALANMTPAQMTTLAREYEQGVGRTRDAGKAILLYKQAVAKNHPEAMVALGDIYDEGSCVDQNMGEAMRLFRRAADLGHAPAFHRIGYMIEGARGVRKDRDEAQRWYLKAAQGGYAPALTKMGELTGEAEWLRKAVAQGHAPAYAKLAGLTNDAEALALLKQGAELKDPAAMFALGIRQSDANLISTAAELGHPAAMSEMARRSERADKPGDAIMWYGKAAAAGDPAGLTWTANRLGEDKIDEAVDMLSRAAQQGYAPAMTKLGVIKADCDLMKRGATGGDAEGMYEFALRCSPADAQAWFLKASEKGHPLALAKLGSVEKAAEAGHRPSMLIMARKDAKWLERTAQAREPEAMRLYAASLTDRGEAARWLQWAAEGGDVEAMRELAKAYDSGTGVMKDQAVATTWYRKAADKGDAFALYRLGLLGSDAASVQRAAEAGIPEAMLKAGELTGNPEWYKKAADAGSVKGWTRLGVANSDSALLERAAKAGDPEAKMHLGLIEQKRKRYKPAYQLFLESANAGYGPAMMHVGDCHMNAIGTWRSEVDAVNWYRKAALAGDPAGLERLKKLGKSQ